MRKLCSLTLIFCFALQFVGCTPATTSEKKVLSEPEQAVSNALYALQAYDDIEIVKYFGVDMFGPDFGSPTQTGIFKKNFTKMTFEIISSTENQDDATVDVKLTTVDTYDSFALLQAKMAEMSNDELAATKDLLILYEEVLESDNIKMITSTVTIPLKKVNGEWTLPFDESYSSALFGLTE